MARARHYLDHNATTPLCAGASEAMVSALNAVGNPSSVHEEGRAARAIIGKTRRLLAARAKAEAEGVVFTSGATEANNQIVRHAIAEGMAVFASVVEHPSILDASPAVATIAVDESGIVDLSALDAALSRGNGDGRPTLVSVMLANNETGVIQPISDIANRVHATGGLLHVDAVQAMGKLDVDMVAYGIDYMSVSAHKFGGPAGVGALIRQSRRTPEVQPLLKGGGQEHNRRAGTENLAGIAGMGGALAALGQRLGKHAEILSLRDWFECEVRAISGQTRIVGEGTARVANTSCLAHVGVSSETAVIRFDLAGVSVGSGSACSSGKVAPSHVLRAMGLGADIVRSAVRVSLGPETTRRDLEAALRVWAVLVSDADTARSAA